MLYLRFNLYDVFIPATVYVVVSGTYYYDIYMDSIGKFWNVSPGTYVLYDVPIGNHFFEAKVIFAKWKGFKEVENNI